MPPKVLAEGTTWIDESRTIVKRHECSVNVAIWFMLGENGNVKESGYVRV